MIITNLKIRNFRNYEKCTLSLQKGIHFIIGKNGQGKTNLLESIYFLSCTRSHRTNNNLDLIKKESPFFMLEADIKKESRMNIKCILNENGKNLYFYQTPVKKVSDFIGTLNAVMFCPSDMFLFESSPKVRRMFIDLELGKLSKTYTSTLNTYYQLLKERNAYLKGDTIDDTFLQVMNEQMIEAQLIIIEQRYQFIHDMIKNSTNFYQQLSNDNTSISVNYLSFVEYEEKDKMRIKMKEKYKKSLQRDKYYGTSNVGIHKDDYLFLMNEHEVSSYASQGQKRSILLAMKLGIARSIYKLTKTYPVLLLDDVFSELDQERRIKLLTLLDQESEEKQIFISSTDKIEINKAEEIYYWQIKNGVIESLKEDK